MLSFAKFPYSGPEVGPEGIRELLVFGFPVVLSYVVETDALVILGYSHTSRDPEYRRRFR